MRVLRRFYNDQYDFDVLIDLPDDRERGEVLPLLVHLHGAGSRGEDAGLLYDGALQKRFESGAAPRCICISPQCKYGDWNTKAKQVKMLIDDLAERYGADPERISITGASMGGFGVYEMILSYPDYFSAAGIVCGGGMEWRAGEITHLPLWIFHGDEDPTVPFRHSKAMVEALAALGAPHVKFTVCHGVGHDSWVDAYERSELLAWLVRQRRSACSVYVAGCTEDGGIHRYMLKADGTMAEKDRCAVSNPMYLCRRKSTVYALLKTAFGPNDGGLVAFDAAEGRLKAAPCAMPTHGAAACHLSVSRTGEVYAVNYTSGTVVKMDRTGAFESVRHTGRSIDPIRQQSAHPHQILSTPDGKYLAVCDLGEDALCLYDPNLCLVSKTRADAGAGPRHLVFSPDGGWAYGINELSNTITCYIYCDGRLEKTKSYPMLPKEHAPSIAAAIRISRDGKVLYASTRGEDKIVVFRADGGALELVQTIGSGGRSPRDFDLSPDGRHLVCANESGKVVLFRVQADGCLVETGTSFDVPGALCVMMW